jgi:hypothetical protein
MSELSSDKYVYEGKIVEGFGGQHDLDFVTANAPSEPPRPS